MSNDDDIIRHPDATKRPSITDEVTRRRFLIGAGGVAAAVTAAGTIQAFGMNPDKSKETCPTPTSDFVGMTPKIIPDPENCKKPSHEELLAQRRNAEKVPPQR